MLRWLAGVVLLVCAAAPARALDYPGHPVTLIVAFPPGGASDVLSRIIARRLEQILGQPLVIENRPGAGGNVAAETVAHAAPDGYTLLNANNAILATNAALYRRINFDAEADFAPIGLIGSQANILVVNPALPVHSLAELIARSPKPIPASSILLPPAMAWQRILPASCSRSRPGSIWCMFPIRVLLPPCRTWSQATCR